MVNWSSLGRDALEEISKRIDNGADYVRFRSVCTSWRSSVPKRLRFPWIVVRYWNDVERVQMGLCEFPKPYFFKPKLHDWMNRDCYICGSSRGWIFLLHVAPPSITLYNPFTEAQIHLPPFTLFHKSFASDAKMDGKYTREFLKSASNSFGTSFLKKLMLSSDPSADPHGCVVMGLIFLGSSLVFLLPGCNQWILTPPVAPKLFLEDIAFYKGRFYAVAKQRVFVCDPWVSAEVTEILPAGPPLYPGPQLVYPDSSKDYLVASSGDLLLVVILKFWRQSSRQYDHKCEVYRVDLSGKHLKLLELKDLGGHSLFLGNDSMSTSAGNSPGCRGNQIYLLEARPVYGDVSRDAASPADNSNPTTAIVRHEMVMIVFDMENNRGVTATSTLSDDAIGNCSAALWLTPRLCN